MNYIIEQKKTINFVVKKYNTGQIEINTFETKWRNLNYRFNEEEIFYYQEAQMINNRMGKIYSTVAKENQNTPENIRLLQLYNKKKKYVLSNKIRDLIKANQEKWKYFVTLTFADNKKNNDYQKVKTIFINWIRNVKKNYKLSFHYIYVIEEHKSGLFHIHLITSDIRKEYLNQAINNKLTSKSYGKKIPNQYNLTLWRYGFTNVKKITKYSDKVAVYVSKYITKVLENDLFVDIDIQNKTFKKNGLNFYGCSRGLERPKVKTIQKDINMEVAIGMFGEVINKTNIEDKIKKEVNKLYPYVNMEQVYQSKKNKTSAIYTQKYFIEKEKKQCLTS